MATSKLKDRSPSRGGIELYSPTYFGACALGGIVSCGPTHTGEDQLVHVISSMC